MKALVTGGAGFIGSHLVDGLLRRGYSVAVLDNLSTGVRDNLAHLELDERLEVRIGSVLDEELVDRLVGQAEVVFHLAAAVGVQWVLDNPIRSLETNLRGTEIVLAAADRHRTPVMVASTSEVYGKNGRPGLKEDSDRVLGPASKSRWAYANAKAFGEMLARSYFVEQGAEMVSVRLFNTVGPRQTGAYGMVLPRFVRQALDGQELTVYGNGTQSRCFTHVLDTVHAILLLCDTELAFGNVYNVGSSTEVPIVELARRVIERVGSGSTVRLVPYEEAYGEGFEELGRRVPDTSALTQLTGWRPTRTIDEAIDDVISAEQSPVAWRG